MLQEKIEVLVKQGKLIDLNTLYNCSQEQLKILQFKRFIISIKHTVMYY